MSPRIVHEPTGEVMAESIEWARSFPERIRGLIGRDLPSGGALVIEPAAQVHTFLMRSPIDVVFCDRNWTVRYFVTTLRPYRVTRWVRGARRAIEMHPGTIPDALRVGDRLDVVPQ